MYSYIVYLFRLALSKVDIATVAFFGVFSITQLTLNLLFQVCL